MAGVKKTGGIWLYHTPASTALLQQAKYGLVGEPPPSRILLAQELAKIQDFCLGIFCI